MQELTHNELYEAYKQATKDCDTPEEYRYLLMTTHIPFED